MTDATSAIVLTHNIDFLFLQSIVHPRLRKSGHPKLTIFADAACASGSYRQQGLLLDGLGRHYRVAQVDLGVGCRFHPKAILLAGPSKAALAVGSGNLTHGGWSANFEIWASYESDDDGLPAISAFRDYLRTIVGLVPQSEAVSEEAFEAFNEATNPWVADLPEPAGLYGVPGDRPLLDTIVELAGNDIQQVTVCAPYYDPDGEAIAELSRRVLAPVNALLQRNHVGLSDSAASALPESIELFSVDVDPPRFIHAKLYAFQRHGSTLLVAGSANMSRAALMSDGSWGNAELVAAQSLSNERAEELLTDLTILDERPELPEIPPSEEWEIQTSPLRIVAARFADRALEIAFKSDAEIALLVAEMDDGTQQQCSHFPQRAVAHFRLNKCPKSVRLHCTLENGEVMSSDPSWVDDEESLGISVPERRIAAKLAEAAEAGSLSASGMFEILQLLHQHLKLPVKQSAPSPAKRGGSGVKTGPRYNVEDVFSDGFGRPRIDPVSQLPAGFRETDFLKAFAAYFSVKDIGKSDDEDQYFEESQTDKEAAEGQEPEEIGNEKVKEELEQRQARRRRSAEGARLRKKLLGALENVVAAMGADEFVSSRPPVRLGSDIAATALLLRKGLVDDIISEDDFADISGRLWDVLFFGSRGEPGVLQRHLASCSPEDSAAFEAAVASPRLTAALTLWCFPDWCRNNAKAIRFRFSATLLAARLPWLVGGGSVEEIHGELRRLTRAMPGGAEFEALVATWTNLIRAGIAFQEFERGVSAFCPKQLAKAVFPEQVNRGDLLWQAGEFCVSHANYRRDQTIRAIVHPLTGASQKKFVGSWLVPVSALLSCTSLLEIDSCPRQVLRNMLAEFNKCELESQDHNQLG